MRRRSTGPPLALGIALMAVAVALGVGWQILVVADLRPVAAGLTGVHWLLLILGLLFFTLLIFGLLLICVWLVREMRLNQRQQEFLDAVTHEMKTPLASLRLFMETMTRHDLPEPRRRNFLDKMGEDLTRLERTVDEVLAAARAEDRVRSARLESTDVADLLRECVDEIRTRHKLSPEAVRLEFASPALAWGDRAELILVFRNLLENAVKYSEHPVRVHVRLIRSADERVRVEISDEGIGIPPRELRKIFMRFYRVGRDVQRQVAGLGLGLFVVRQMVRRQGGRVVATSEGDGQGSRFVVTLRAPPMEPVSAAPYREPDASALRVDV